VVIAFSAARWVAMAFNRIVDREFDARNPRTQNRELPRGALSVTQAWVSSSSLPRSSSPLQPVSTVSAST
jgi:4-hydroxybenzoate polyprenyltransferase